MKSPLKFPIWLQVLGWLVFLVFPMLLAPPPSNVIEGGFNPELIANAGPYLILVFQISLVVFFYVNANYLIPKYLAKGDLNKYFLWIGFSILCLVFLLIGAQFQLRSLVKEMTGMMTMIHYLFSLVLFLFVLIISNGSKIVETWYDIEREAQEMRLQKVGLELSLLKSQINPHFLFNTLNSIYVLSEQKSEKTGDAIIQISNMMRYVLFETHYDFVPLKQEINYIKSYIEMQALRLPKNIQVDFKMDLSCEDLFIAPMLLIVFIENAYKHGANTHEQTFVTIKLKTTQEELILFTQNRIFNNLNLVEPNSGHGLENVQKRLEISYPNRHQLDITRDSELYTLHLRIKI